MPAPETRFLLNDQLVATSRPPGLLVLDFLRAERRLTGTKEGCKEGDCGACGVLIGDIVNGELVYRPVTSCLVPLGELDGKHLVTIEGISHPDRLSPVQQAVVDEGGTQCGYCTPGIIVSLTHCAMEHRGAMTSDHVKEALSGHLCRCTGYASLNRAGARIQALWDDDESDALSLEGAFGKLVSTGLLPPYFLTIPDRIRELRKTSTAGDAGPSHPPADVRIAGGTDLYVQQGEQLPERSVDVLNLYPEMKGIHRRNGSIEVGALTTFEAVATDPEFLKLVPRIRKYMFLIASLQIRNRATLSGNVINASPIGDMTILLLALEAEITLRAGDVIRTLPLHALYKGYKQLDMAPDEILTQFTIPVPAQPSHVHFEKVSKRKCLDIASVNTAIKLTLDGNCIAACSLAMGGVAPIPKTLPEAGARVIGREVSAETVRLLQESVQSEIAPISDVRGSADYKRLLAHQLVLAHFLELFPDRISPEEVA